MLRYANLVENYPGFPAGIKGKLLIKKIQNHFKSQKLSVITKCVTSVKFYNHVFAITAANKKYYSKYLVIASGSLHVEYRNYEISASIKNKIFYDIEKLEKVKNCKIIIVGGGDLAYDYSLSLCRKNSITIVCRSDVPNCIPLLKEKAANRKNISIRINAELVKVIIASKNKLFIKIIIKDIYGHRLADDLLEADYIIFAIGRRENLDFLSKGFKKDINLLSKSGRLFLIGDAANKKYRQSAISAGDGVKTAMKIYESERETV